MWKRFLPIFLLSLVSTSHGAQDKAICGSVEGCKLLIKLAQARLQELSNKNEIRVSITGSEFKRDNSNPKLGEAYKDPSGLIWGDIVHKDSTMTQEQADKYCKSIGARLPTKEEFANLAKYLGKDSDSGYWPYIIGSEEELLPNLSLYSFWSSSVHKQAQFEGFDFYGYTSTITFVNSFQGHAVRCVQ